MLSLEYAQVTVDLPVVVSDLATNDRTSGQAGDKREGWTPAQGGQRCDSR